MVMSGQRDPCRSPMQWDKSKNSGFTQGNNTMLGVVNFFYSKTLGTITVVQRGSLLIFFFLNFFALGISLGHIKIPF